jgi:hypothetical protein
MINRENNWKGVMMSWKLKEFERSMFTVMEVVDEKGEVIKVFVADESDYTEKKKEAQLIATAPELLKAVEQGYEMIDTLAGLSSWDGRSEDEINEVMNQMLEAMGKAKGGGENDKN